ncbi:MAG TPA: Ig-like domain-containing protein [Gemmatimonadales bacterium]|nr:Ig-like domain-containing protein [Gemmatimonadales bacterium]
MRKRLAAGLALSLLMACSDRTADPTPAPPTGDPSILLSAPVSQSLLDDGGTSSTLVFVSARLGTFPRGARATVARRGSRTAVEARVAGGGFDAVPLRASVGDEIEVVVTDSAGARRVETGTARAPARPKVVRTSPRPTRSDVPLNSIVQVVFSAPMDAASVAAALELYHGETRVPGTVALTDQAGTIASFVPEAPFAPSTDYRLVLAASARDVLGQALDSSVVVTFTTGAPTSAPPINVVAIDREVERLEPGEAADVRAFVCAQRSVPCVEVTAELSWTSTSPGVAVVEGLGATAGPGQARITAVSVGEARIVAAAGGQSDTMALYVSVSSANTAANELVFSSQDPSGPPNQYPTSANLFAIRADGTGLTQLTRGAANRYTQPSVARDGRIVFVDGLVDGIYPVELSVRERDGTVHPLSPSATQGLASCPTWSPDTRYIAYVKDGSIRVVRTDGSGSIVAQINGYGDSRVACPSWSPDGTRLSFGLVSGFGAMLAVTDATLFPVVSTRVGEWRAGVNFGRWSPAGDGVVSFVEEGARIWLERTPLDNTQGVRMDRFISVIDCCSIVGLPYVANWSSDGTLVAFHLGDGGILLVDATGGGLHWMYELPITGSDPSFVPAGVSFTR